MQLLIKMNRIDNNPLIEKKKINIHCAKINKSNLSFHIHSL